MNISFRSLKNEESDFTKLHKWCQEKDVYEWFEQRILSLDEIRNKYQKKILEGKQELLIITCDNNEVGLVQIYPYISDVNDDLNGFHNLYEYDIFIGNKNYLSKGIGQIIVKKVNDMIYEKYQADGIVLRPFKRNIRAIKCYEKCGFQIVNEYKSTNTIGNIEVVVTLLHQNDIKNIVILKNDYLRWKEMFNDEKIKLNNLFKDYTITIEHVGSTSVDNLLAKPIIDIAIGIKNIDEINSIIKELKKFYIVKYNKEEVLLIKESENTTFFLIHVLNVDSERYKNMLLFRDILINNKEIKAKYEKLKCELQKKYLNNRKQYTKEKGVFIKDVLNTASIY